MSDKLKLRMTMDFFVDCNEEDIPKIKDRLEDLGWFIVQETHVKKAIGAFEDAEETGYEVEVVELSDEDKGDLNE